MERGVAGSCALSLSHTQARPLSPSLSLSLSLSLLLSLALSRSRSLSLSLSLTPSPLYASECGRVIVFFFASLRSRVQGKGQAVLRAMFRTLGDAAQEDGMELTDAEKAQATSTGTARHSEVWKKSILAAKAKSLKRQNTRSFSQEAAGASDMTA